VDSFTALVEALGAAGVRFVVIGVWGINHYARSGGTIFHTEDRDLFLPLDAISLRRAWDVCAAHGYELWAGREPLDVPRDELLAKRIVELRALTTAIGPGGVHIDLSLVMTGLTFEEVWARRRTFCVDGVEIPVARLTDIVTSKAAAGREKDRLFLATHAEAIRRLQRDDEPGA
jgi:hypothetical protein